MRRQAAVPLNLIVPTVLLALAGLFVQKSGEVPLGPDWLLPVLASAFGFGLPVAIAVLALLSYQEQGARIFVLLGCGLVAPGVGNLLAALTLTARHWNLAVTVQNAGVLIGGSCHLAAVCLLLWGAPLEPSTRSRRPPWLGIAAYLSAGAFMAIIALLASRRLLPPFFPEGGGPSMLRQAVLSVAAITYTMSALMLMRLHAQTGTAFLGFYSNGLLLTAVGLGVSLAQDAVGGGIFAWVGRASQFVGNLYFILAVVVGRCETASRGTTLPAYLSELFRSHLNLQVRQRTEELTHLNLRLGEEIEERRKVEARLRMSEQVYRSILEHSLQGIAIIQDGRIRLCNEALCRINGFTAEEAYRMSAEEVFATVHPQDRERAVQAMAQILESGDSLPAEVMRLLDREGRVHWVQMLGVRTTFRGKPALQISYNDVTGRRRAEEAYRTLVENAREGYAILKEGRVVFANRALARISGYEASELARMSAQEIQDMIHPADRDRVARTMAGRLAGRDVPEEQSFRFQRRDGTWRIVETNAVVVEHEGGAALQVGYNDVTEERKAQDELKAAHRKMRNLATHLLRAREEERRKVAQEIHDELGQTLAALKMDAHWLLKHVKDAPQTVMRKLKGMIALGERTIGSVQKISSDLRPRMLDDLGLAPALDWLAGDFKRRTGILCAVSFDVPAGKIGGNAATSLYRVVQEGLSNVARHSRARHSSVSVEMVHEGLALCIRDDGVGITAAQAESPDSFGLIGMHERIEGLGGKLSVAGEPGQGTTLIARVPLPEEGGLA